LRDHHEGHVWERVTSATLAAESMSVPHPRKQLSLTLIVAATPSLGIGKNGGLPWPSHKADMGYFARVTKRVPPQHSRAKNAVIMGRKTWDSIPLKFRPLRDRINVVLTRNPDFDAGEKKKDEVIVASSFEKAIEILEQRTQAAEEHPSDADEQRPVPIARAFVIGGNTNYKAALELPQTDRVLLTKIFHDYDCDTHFPVDLEGDGAKKAGWTRRSAEELSTFVGEDISEGRKEENGIEYEFCMFEKEA
jgi:dihydrofolate reductase